MVSRRKFIASSLVAGVVAALPFQKAKAAGTTSSKVQNLQDVEMLGNVQVFRHKYTQEPIKVPFASGQRAVCFPAVYRHERKWKKIESVGFNYGTIENHCVNRSMDDRFPAGVIEHIIPENLLSTHSGVHAIQALDQKERDLAEFLIQKFVDKYRRSPKQLHIYCNMVYHNFSTTVKDKLPTSKLPVYIAGNGFRRELFMIVMG